MMRQRTVMVFSFLALLAVTLESSHARGRFRRRCGTSSNTGCGCVPLPSVDVNEMTRRIAPSLPAVADNVTVIYDFYCGEDTTWQCAQGDGESEDLACAAAKINASAVCLDHRPKDPKKHCRLIPNVRPPIETQLKSNHSSIRRCIATIEARYQCGNTVVLNHGFGDTPRDAQCNAVRIMKANTQVLGCVVGWCWRETKCLPDGK